MIIFSGETPYQALVNHNGLNIIEEDAFLSFLESKGFGTDAAPEILESLYDEFSEGYDYENEEFVK